MINTEFYNSGRADNQVLFDSSSTAEDLDSLQKAMEAGQTTGRELTNSTSSSMAPLKVESLERTLKNQTFAQKNIVFWKNVPKENAYNTVEEYNELSSYGPDRGGFYSEGELPNVEDSVYVRRAQLVKFLGITKAITHPAMLVNTTLGTGKIMQKEIDNGTLWILRKLERALFYGDATTVPQEFNGIITQQKRSDVFSSLNDYYTSQFIVDMRGAKLTEIAIERAAEGIIENFGMGTKLYAPPNVLSGFSTNFYGNKYIQVGTDAITNGKMGQRVKTFESQFGPIDLEWDIFMNKRPTKLYGAASEANRAPNAITAGVITAVGSDVLSKWASAEAGDYFYAVAPFNQYGVGALTTLSNTTTSIVAAGAVDLQWTDGGGADLATGYRVYRSDKNAATAAGATYYPLFEVSVAEKATGYDGGAAATVRDRSRIMPNTNEAVLFEETSDNVEFKQLAPLMKMDLALVAPAFRFMMLLYGTMFLYTPKKMIRFINIGLF